MARAHGRQPNPPNPLRNRRPFPRPAAGAGLPTAAAATQAAPVPNGLFTQAAPPAPPDHLMVGEPAGPTPPPAGSPGAPVGGGFLRSVHMTPAGAAGNPLPLVQALDQVGGMVLDPGVTFLVGENGAGKSTLLAAMAAAAGLEAGLDPLANGVSLNWASSPRTGFVSRGEAPSQRFEPGGLYLIDEPEATLSVRGCMALLRDLYDLAWAGAGRDDLADRRRGAAPGELPGQRQLPADGRLPGQPRAVPAVPVLRRYGLSVRAVPSGAILPR